jgi:hypothetical protein
MEDNKQALSNILTKYGVPDPKIVGKLPKGNAHLDFVGHADVTKFLLETDPNWRWVPIEWKDGRPAIHVENGMATMWGELTVLGQSRLGVGSVRADKADLDKELVSDFIRNAAMRFGFCLSLWTKQEWEDLDNNPKPARQATGGAFNKPIAAKPAPVAEETEFLTNEQRQQFVGACARVALDPAQVARHAGIKWEEDVKQVDLPKLRESYNALKVSKEGN